MARSESDSGPVAGFETIDHTADVALRVWAPSLEELFAEAARGLVALLTDADTVVARQRCPLTVEGIDLEELLVAWLNEILYRFESEGLLLAEFESLRIVGTDGPYRLTAVGAGETRQAGRHPSGVGVKSATYHNLRIAPDAQGRYDVTLVLDT